MEQIKLLQTIGKIFDKLNIPYFITGGMAVVVWGRPRFTADVDIVVELLPQNLEKLARELLQIDKDVYLDRRIMQEALRKRGEFNFFHPASGIKVDFWVLKGGPYSKEQLKRRVKKNVGERALYFSSAEDLILSKLLWYQQSFSTRQLEDIESVLRIQKKLDMRYIRVWARRHNTLETLEPLLKTRYIP